MILSSPQLNITVSFVGVNQGVPDFFQRTPPPPADAETGLSAGGIVGIIIAILVILILAVIAIIAVLLYFGPKRRKYELATAYGSQSHTYVTDAEAFSNPVYTDAKTSSNEDTPYLPMGDVEKTSSHDTAKPGATQSETTSTPSQAEGESSPKQNLSEEDKNTHL